MKTIIGLLFLILVPAQLDATEELVLFVKYVKSYVDGYLHILSRQFTSAHCPGYCLPETISNGCPIVYTNIECPGAKICCAFSLQIDLLNKTNITPHTIAEMIVNKHQDVPTKDEEIYYDNNTAQPTYIPSTTYNTTEDLKTEGEENNIETVSDIKDKDATSCPGVCFESRLTSYCEAYLNSTNLCQSGKLCCVSKSLYGDNYPLNLVVPSEPEPSVEQSLTMSSITLDPVQNSGRKCTGECLSGLYFIFCDEIDKDASCPSERTCCLRPKTATITTS